VKTRRLIVPLRQTLRQVRQHCAANARMGLSDYNTRAKRIAEERRTLQAWGWSYRRRPQMTHWIALRFGGAQ
jgi:hypothetical protein